MGNSETLLHSTNKPTILNSGQGTIITQNKPNISLYSFQSSFAVNLRIDCLCMAFTCFQKGNGETNPRHGSLWFIMAHSAL